MRLNILYLALIFLIKVTIQGEDYAPLLPLSDPYPLEISSKNEQDFLTGDVVLKKEKEKLKRLLNERRFPWISIIVLFSLIGTSYAAYYFRDLFDRKAIKTAHEIFKNRLDEIERIQDREAFAQKGAELFKEMLALPSTGMTTKETIGYLENSIDYQKEELKKIKWFLETTDQIKFKPDSKEVFFDELHALKSYFRNFVSEYLKKELPKK